MESLVLRPGRNRDGSGGGGRGNRLPLVSGRPGLPDAEPGETVCGNHKWHKPGDYDIIVILRDVHGNTYWSELWTISIVNMTKLDIGYISDGLLNIKTEIKNIGEYPALQVNWSITIRGRLGLIYKKWSGEIKVINPDKSEKVTTGFILGFGKYNITVTAEAFNAPNVSKSING